MHGSRPAGGEQGIVAGVLAALGHVYPSGAGHILVHDVVNAPRHFRQREPDLRGQGPHGSFRGLGVNGHGAAHEEPRIEITQQQVGVGHRGGCPSPLIACGAGLGTRALGTHLEQAHFIHVGYAAASRADFN